MLSYQKTGGHAVKGFQSGIKASIPIAIGYIPIAMAFGLIAKTTGLAFSEALGMSLLVYAGASQFMALQMITAGTTGLEIVLATFIINIRHFLLTASLSEKISERSLLKRSLIAFGVTDETFSVASLRTDDIKPVFMGGLLLTAYGSWVVFTGVGYWIGSELPEVIKESMGIALYAMFIGLIVPSLKKHRKVVVLFSVAAVLSTCFSLFMSSGWAIVVATLVSCIGVELVTFKKPGHGLTGGERDGQ